jgi:membrane protease subunit HflK
MAGNEQQNPWGNSSNQGQPPELEELINDLKEKFNSFFGKKNNKSNDEQPSRKIPFGIVIGLALVIWMAFGFYIVNPAEQAAELRFGKFQRMTSEGLNWRLPYPIETVDIVNVSEVRKAEIGFRKGINARGVNYSGNVTSESLMLTKDLNIIDIKFEVQYKINNAKYYLFNIKDPETTLREVSESAIRSVIGKNNMDYIIENRSVVSELIEESLQRILNSYKVGLEVTSVNMQDAQPPEQVQDAYSDAVKAKEDNKRLINDAEAYANDILPKARGLSARMIQEAKAYEAQVVAKADGEAKRFDKIRIEYEKAPVVTKKRLYLETIESVLSKTTKVVMDSKSNSMMYLPLDKLLSNQNNNNNNAAQNNSTNNVNSSNSRDLSRNRGNR